ncbi:hypothetical protein BDW62DRAFT_168059 [Aspergillus aurantiobrunneus]
MREIVDMSDKITLTTIQGLAVMYSCSSVMGKDRLGWTYLVRASNAVSLLRSPNVDLPETVVSEHLDHLELGFFGAAILSCISLQKTPPMDIPKCPYLPIHQANQGQWFPYPLQIDPVPEAHRNCVLKRRVILGEYTSILTHGLFGDDGRPPRADIQVMVDKCYNGLLRWNEEHPKCLHYTNQSVPEILSLHMYYHLIIMSGFGFLKVPVPDADQVTLESISAARETCIVSARAISDLVAIYRSRWGPDRATCSDAQYICIALFMLMDDLDNQVSHSAFLNLARAAMAMSARWLLLKGMFRQVQIITFQSNETLSPDIVKLSKRFERRLWRSEDRRRFSSAYPNFAAALQAQDEHIPEDLEMDQFLEIWNDFSIADQADFSASEIGE